MRPYGIEALHPDAFALVLIELAPQLVIAAMRACRARLVHPVLSADDYLAVLARRELPETAAFLRANNAEI